jgi:asparagine synthetase B (glutamine-hydrolysing)
MNVILGGSRVSDQRKELARKVAGDLGAGHLDEWTSPSGSGWIAAGSDGGAAVTAATHGDSARAAFGSGVRTLADPGTLVGDGLLDGQDDDLVAVACDDSRVVVAGGRGNHRLFLTAFPEGGAMVSSHVGLLARVRGDDLGLDRSYEDFLLGFGFLPDGRTPFAGISTLSPGTRRTFGGSADGDVETVAPPRIPATDDAPTSFDGASDVLYERFCAAIDDQAGTDERHAVLLGGFDSALVAAALRRLGHEVQTFTFTFGDPRYEQSRADEIARHIGAEHTRVEITPGAIMDALAGYADLYPQPGPQPHYPVHTLVASRLLRVQGYDHVFSGDGCDATFLGYPTVSRRARILQRLGHLPAPAVRAALAALGTRPADRHLGHVARMGRSTLHSLLLPEHTRGHLPTCYLDRHTLARLRQDAPPAQAETIEQIRERLAAEVPDLDTVRLAYDGMARTGQSRTKVDGAVATTGVVQRSPFLHPALRSFVTGLPTEYLRPPGMPAGASGKALLIETVRRHELLPEWIIDLPKQSPSDSPIDTWYAGPLRQDVLALLRNLPFEVDADVIDEVLRPKRAEDLYRERVSLGHQAFQSIGLLCSYAAFTSLASG